MHPQTIHAALSPSQREIAVQLVNDVPNYARAGETVMLTLSPQELVVSEIIDTLLFGFKPVGLRADEVCPIQLVDVDIGQYRVFGLNNAFRPINVISSIQADIPEVDVDSSLQSYQVQERALGGFIPTVTQLNATNSRQAFDPKAALARKIAYALALEREIRVWTMLKTSGSWNAANRATISAGAEWNDAENGDPMTDIMDRIEATAQPITDIWVNPLVAHSVLRSKSIKDYIRTLGGDAGPVGRDIAQATTNMNNMDFVIPGLPPFHVVASKVLNESTGALDFILDDTVILTSSPPGAGSSGEDMMTCKTFRRRGPSGNGWTTREFQLERRGLHGGVFMASGYAEQIAMIAGTVGGAIFNTIQP